MRNSAPTSAMPVSRRDWILSWLRGAIASGELKPGDRLVERDISARSGVSRGPVREAIMVLEQEGLVVSHLYRGAEVAGISQREVREVLVPIRTAIERFAFREVVALPDRGALVAELERLVAEMERVGPGDDGAAERLADLDVAFHEAVISASGHTQSLQIWRTILPRVRAYFLRDAPRHADPDEIPGQHRALLAALRRGDADALDDDVVQHIGFYLGD
ncbi:GntR family transcriptional regulator [Saccharopolyspora sp. CA-218241]|uniref:GntR family transcriptional regulator n=1 Tax=Saccharopolyspora sp. CA-218241 TaxID=3240027 RepID=UPI003D98ACC7